MSTVKVLYTNYRGELSERIITVPGLRYGTSEWHTVPTLLLEVWDTEKLAYREFKLTDIRPIEQ